MSDDLISALVVRRGALAWSTLRRKKNRLEVAETRQATFEVPAGVTDLAAPEVVQRLKPLCAQIGGRVAVAMPAEQVLLRVVRLPTVDTAEIREMAALQVDKFSPFPVEQMAISQEVLHQQDGASRVLVAAVLQEHVQKLGNLLRSAGVHPREVDVEVLGWWRLLKQGQHIPAEGRHLLLLLDEAGTEMIVAQDGVPVILRSLGSHRHLAPAESAAEVAEEMNYTLTTLESEWGAQAPDVIRVWHRDEVPVEFLARLRELSEVEVETCSLEKLPPLTEGLARRAAERAPHILDLAPPDWKTALESRHLKRVLLTVSGVFVALWLIAVLALGVGLNLQKRQLGAARAELKALQEPARLVGQLKDQVRSLERYADRTYSGLECLREIVQVLPEGVDITAFTYKKYGQINLRGEADSSDPIYDFFQALEQSQLFPEVKPEGVTQQQRAGKTRSQFKVTIALPEEKP
jgi:Tfp pilus assembly protein PilN